MQAVLLCLLIYIILFFPLSLTFNLVLDMQVKKLYVNISLFNVTLFGGYITAEKFNIYFHFGKRVKILKTSDYLLKKKKISVVKGSGVYSLRTLTLCGISNPSAIYCGTVISSINNIATPIICEKYKYMKIKNDIFFTNDNGIYTIVKIGILFNLFSIILLAFKILINKVANGKQK